MTSRDPSAADFDRFSDAVGIRPILTHVLAPGFVIVALFQLGLLKRWYGYHAIPSPKGMVAQFELRPVVTPLDEISIRVQSGSPCVLEVRRGVPTTTARFEYGALTEEGAGTPFDFDGNGVEDRIVHRTLDGDSQVVVRSGASDVTLYEQLDPGRWTTTANRGYALPDLDGDGRSELALHHPREDRSQYDRELVDMVLDVKSWVTVVSYPAR